MPQHETTAEPAAQDVDKQFGEQLQGAVKPEVAIALSGGGYKAGLFHLGSLIRINELGALKKINRFSSVSGGSITAGYLAKTWHKLVFDAAGVATNFDAVFHKPLAYFFATAQLDIAAGVGGVLGPGLASEKLADAYDRWLYKGTTLQQIPDAEAGGPRFVFNATNMQLNSLFRFERKRAADHRLGEVPYPDLLLAKVVAASSGFPPPFAPVIFKFSRGAFKPLPGSNRAGPYAERLWLADGGIYDNMGLEQAWRSRTVLVSNAGDPFGEEENPKSDWASQLQRVISVMHRQCENNRMRWLIDMAKRGERNVAAWALRSRPEVFDTHGGCLLTDAQLKVAQNVGVRLTPPSENEQRMLICHGYALADAAVRSFWLEGMPPTTKWPS